MVTDSLEIGQETQPGLPKGGVTEGTPTGEPLERSLARDVPTGDAQLSIDTGPEEQRIASVSGARLADLRKFSTIMLQDRLAEGDDLENRVVF